MTWYDQWLVVTDLDGTLLDHHSYTWQPASDAISLLHQHQVPLILCSSKTLAEMQYLATELNLAGPLIVENGAAVVWPSSGEPRIESLGRPRSQILTVVHQLRRQDGYDFAGFADWQDQDVATHTGLELAAAGRARQRVGTEPILWHDSPERYQTFVEQLAAESIRAVAGGRFIHLMGQFDKADGLARVRAGLGRSQVLALGDSPNDAGMLKAADVAVVIQSARSSEVAAEIATGMAASAPVVLRPAGPGPIGWQRAVTAWWQAQGAPAPMDETPDGSEH